MLPKICYLHFPRAFIANARRLQGSPNATQFLLERLMMSRFSIAVCAIAFCGSAAQCHAQIIRVPFVEVDRFNGQVRVSTPFVDVYRGFDGVRVGTPFSQINVPRYGVPQYPVGYGVPGYGVRLFDYRQRPLNSYGQAAPGRYASPHRSQRGAAVRIQVAKGTRVVVPGASQRVAMRNPGNSPTAATSSPILVPPPQTEAPQKSSKWNPTNLNELKQ